MILAAIMEDISSVRHLEVIPGAYTTSIQKQAQEGNSRLRLEMTNKRAKTCQNVKKMFKNVKKGKMLIEC